MLNKVKPLLALVYVIPIAILLFFYDLTKRNPKQCVPGQIPIFLIHGYLYRSGGWAYIYYHLRKRGYQNIYTINLGSPFQSIEDYAQAVKKKIDDIGAPEIILIGHSMGGVIATYYDRHLAKPGSVKQIITLGSPLEGTRLTFLGFGACVNEMSIGSSLLKTLSKEPSQTPYLHIASRNDLMIQPWESALFLSSQATHAKRQVIDLIGHLQLLFSKRIVYILVDQLANNSIKL